MAEPSPDCVSQPPMIGPMMKARPDTAPQKPMARPRSSFAKFAVMSESVAGIMADPPMPCTTRNAMSWPTFCANRKGQSPP